jgi:hypothetical protein
MKLTHEQCAYLAGFLDGDGSLFAQIVKGTQYKYKFHIRVSIVFFQKTSSHWLLLKFKDLIGFGVVRKRKDHISELVITGSDSVHSLLDAVYPFLILKKPQASYLYDIISSKRSIVSLQQFITICKLVDKLAALNYSKNRTVTSLTVINEHFPLETSIK